MSAAKKERTTIYIDKQLLNSARNIVFYTPGMTLTEVVCDAFAKEVEYLEDGHGAPFPQRSKNKLSTRKVSI